LDIRRNIKSDATAKANFVAAVLGLKARPSQMHPSVKGRSRYDDYVEVHLNAMMVMHDSPSWGHKSTAFGPWHRALLRHFELDLQTVTPGVTIPYWDWTDAASTTAVFSDDPNDQGFGGNGTEPQRTVTNGAFRSDAATGKTAWPLRVTDKKTDPKVRPAPSVLKK
jgi:tyrosinase